MIFELTRCGDHDVSVSQWSLYSAEGLVTVKILFPARMIEFSHWITCCDACCAAGTQFNTL